MLLLSREDIKKVFSMRDAIEANKIAYKLTVDNECEVPLRPVIQAPKDEGAFLFMPAYAEKIDTASIKIVNIFPNNAKEGLPTAPAQVLLYDGRTGICEAILDGTYVTQLRTGAASGVAFDLLARRSSSIGAIIGTGSQAECQIEAMLEACNLEELRVYSRNADNTQSFVEKMNEKFMSQYAKIIAVNSSDEAIDNADIIVTVTPSTKPVFDGTKVKKGATLSCVGSYQHHMQELDPAVLPRVSKIYFDSTEAVLSEAGDITIPLKEGIITEKDFTGDIGNVIKGELASRENEDEIILFKNVGVASLDLVAARTIFDKAKEKGVGMEWK